MIKMKLLLNSLSKRFQKFTNDKYDVRIKWLTGKKTPFKLKDLCLHTACKIYKGVCIWRETYIGKTIPNVETRWKEHNTPSDKPNLSKRQ